MTEQATLQSSPDRKGSEVLLAGSGSAAGGYARLDPAEGAWLWATATGGRPLAGWAGTTAVFSGLTVTPDASAVGTTLAVDASGARVGAPRAGAFVAAAGERMLLAAGRDLTGLTTSGRVAWKASLPASVTRPGTVTGRASKAVFTSVRGPGRVSVVDLDTGDVTTHRVPEARPVAWVTETGVVVTDAVRPSAITFYDAAWRPVWALAGVSEVEDVARGHVLVTDAGAATVSIYRLLDGQRVWTSLPDDHQFVGGSLVATDDGGTLIAVTSSSDASGAENPVLFGVDSATGAPRFTTSDRQYVGTWNDFVLLCEVGKPVLSAISATDGISYATLNIGSPVSASTGIVTGDTLVYLDATKATARAIELSDRA